MKMRSFEEYIRGPEGDAEAGAVGAIGRALEQAKAAGVPNIQIEARVSPSTGEASRQEGTWNARATDDPSVLGSRILELLTDSPGPSFAGEVRLNFRAAGDTRMHFSSFTRQIQPATIGGVDVASEEEGSPDYWQRMARKHAEISAEYGRQSVNLMGAFAHLAGGAAQIMIAHGRATGRLVDPPPAAQGSSMVPDLLRGVLRTAEAAAGRDSSAGRAAGAVASAMETGAPAPPPSESGDIPDIGTTPPTPPPDGDGGGGAGEARTFTAADAERWARANPDAARQMALKLMSEGA